MAQVVGSLLQRLAEMSLPSSAADGSLAAACAALEALFACKAPDNEGWQPLEAPCTSASGGGGSRALADLLIMLARSGDSSRARPAVKSRPHMIRCSA